MLFVCYPGSGIHLHLGRECWIFLPVCREFGKSYVLAANEKQPGERTVSPIKENYLNCQILNRRADRNQTPLFGNILLFPFSFCPLRLSKVWKATSFWQWNRKGQSKSFIYKHLQHRVLFLTYVFSTGTWKTGFGKVMKKKISAGWEIFVKCGIRSPHPSSRPQ